jgi:hypothetical protein
MNQPVPPDPRSVPPEYWLGVARGFEAARAFLGSPVEATGDVLHEYPILGLPEFPDALRALARTQPDPRAARACADGAQRLTAAHARILAHNAAWRAFTLFHCGVVIMMDFFERPAELVLARRAADLFREGRAVDSSDPEIRGRSLVSEADARGNLAGAAIDPAANDAEAARLYTEARTVLPPDHAMHVHALNQEIVIRQRLKDRGLDQRANLEALVGAYAEARAGRLPGDESDLARRWAEAQARSLLADLGGAPVENLVAAKRLLEEVHGRLPLGAEDRSRALLNEAQVLANLGALGVEPAKNFDEALRLYDEGRRGVGGDRDLVARSMLGEARVRAFQATLLGKDFLANLGAAVRLHSGARTFLPPGDRDFAIRF